MLTSAEAAAAATTSPAQSSTWPSTPYWIEVALLKVLAGANLTDLFFEPIREVDLRYAPDAQALQQDHLGTLEWRTVLFLTQYRPVAAVNEMELALRWCHEDSQQSTASVVRRLHQLLASATILAFDLLADLDRQAGGCTRMNVADVMEQAFKMLSLASELSEPKAAARFGAQDVAPLPFLRAMVNAGLGSYYWSSNKLSEAMRHLEAAASGHAGLAHPAVLLNLSSVRTCLQEPTKAMLALNEAVLGLRSATGPLTDSSAEGLYSVAISAEIIAARALGATQSSGQAEEAAVSGQLLAHLLPPSSGEALEGSRSRVPSMDAGNSDGGCNQTSRRSSMSVPPPAPPPPPNGKRRLLGQAHSGGAGGKGPLGARTRALEKAKGAGHSCNGPCACYNEGEDVEATVTHVLLTAKMLMLPWQELGEGNAGGSGHALGAILNGPRNRQLRTYHKLPQWREQACAGIAKHTVNLQRNWPLWQRPAQQVQPGKLSGVLDTLRQCLLLSFFNAAVVISLRSPASLYGLWVLPLLRQGLVLTSILLGTKHPIAKRFMNACHRAARVSLHVVDESTGAAIHVVQGACSNPCCAEFGKPPVRTEPFVHTKGRWAKVPEYLCWPNDLLPKDTKYIIGPPPLDDLLAKKVPLPPKIMYLVEREAPENASNVRDLYLGPGLPEAKERWSPCSAREARVRPKPSPASQEAVQPSAGDSP